MENFLRYSFLASSVAFSFMISGCNTNDGSSANDESTPASKVLLLDYTPGNSESGSSDASGAIALDNDFMIVGDDEENILRVYPRIGGDQVLEFDFNSILLTEEDLEKEKTAASELDVEAVTRYDTNKLLVVGSHGNKKGGDDVPEERGHIVAIEYSGTGADTTFEILGKYSNLEADIIAWDSENGHNKGAGYFGLAASAAEGLSPERVNGMSIEGATVSHDGTQLFLGFRAPQTDQTLRTTALIITVDNYKELIAGTADGAIFGEPMELNLGGRGIRDISQWGNQFLISAGPASASIAGVTENFALYAWSGESTDAPTQIDYNMEELRAENNGSIETIVQPHTQEVSEQDFQFLLDNGDSIWEGESAVSKDLDPENQKFQGAYLPSIWTIKTDNQAPQLKTITPANSTLGVNTDSRIQLNFDEGIRLGNGSISVYQEETLFSTYTKDSPEVSVSFNSLSIIPVKKLNYSTDYHIEVNGSFVEDTQGNQSLNQGIVSEFFSAGEPTPLTVGDIVFVAANAESPDGIAFMLKKDINGGTEITFSDRNYLISEGTFWKKGEPATNEGVFRWTADRDMKAGDIITIQTDTALSPIADFGQVLGAPSGIGKAETMYAMIGTEVEDLIDGNAGIVTETGNFIAVISIGGVDEEADIPSELLGIAQSFYPVGADTDEDLNDQTNVIFDVDTCGRDQIDIESNINEETCWKVTFKSDGAVGFPLTNSGSLFERPLISE